MGRNDIFLERNGSGSLRAGRAFSHRPSILNARSSTFQLNHHGRTDEQTNGQKKPIVELRVRNQKRIISQEKETSMKHTLTTQSLI